MKKYICGECFKPVKRLFDDHFCDQLYQFGGRSLREVLKRLEDEKQDRKPFEEVIRESDKYLSLLTRVTDLEVLLAKKCTKCGNEESVGSQVRKINRNSPKL